MSKTIAKSLTTDEWIALIGRKTHEPEIASLLIQHEVDLDRITWIHGCARKGLRKVGVYLSFWKTGVGKAGVIDISGVTFAHSGMRGGIPYPGDFPFDLEPGDSPTVALGKMPAGKTSPLDEHRTIHVRYDDCRIVLEFDRQAALMSVWWLSTEPRART